MRHYLTLTVLVLVTASFLYLLNRPVRSVPALGPLLEPVSGVFGLARKVDHPANATVTIPGLTAETQVIFDDRGVPHIFADDPLDAVRALGYAVARHRLFQLDFIPRVASGSLSEVFGSSAIEADRFLRHTGMSWAARNNALRVQEEDGIEQALADAFCDGANAYIDALRPGDLPVEYQLIGHSPGRCDDTRIQLVTQYMSYNLTWGSDAARYGEIRDVLGDALYETLYGGAARLAVPIIPGERQDRPIQSTAGNVRELHSDTGLRRLAKEMVDALLPPRESFLPDPTVPGIGSNNWAVSGERSTTGAPILAGDMHLDVNLPAIWYEAHIVTPQFNSYGVTIPGAPITIAAFNQYLGWTFTNTGADQIDHFELQLNADGTRYFYDERWLDIDFQVDTIRVAGGADVIDTLRFSHWGPVTDVGGRAVATRWTAHLPNKALYALWGMHHATDLDSFNGALRNWHAPMQNVLYADVHGNIAIRSTGHLPVRGSGSGIGIQDGSLAGNEWLDPIPFEELPHVVNPARGYLASTNQIPVGPDYPHYLGHRWPDALRSIRIDTLMRRKERHSVEDLKRYQTDVKAIHVDLMRERLKALSGLSGRAEELRNMLLAWDGYAHVDAHEPLVLHELLQALHRFMWQDYDAELQRARPSAASMIDLIRRGRPVEVPGASPPERDPLEVLHRALEAAADTLEARHGWAFEAWRWGNHNKVVFRHMTGSDALRAFGRGPYEFPGFQSTLLPAERLLTTHTDSWRVVVDFSASPPRGYGVYPGGQSGNPFSPLYERHIETYLAGEYFDLRNPPTPEGLPPEVVSERITLRP